MTTLSRFAQLLAEYDVGHVKAAAKNKRVYRNPYASLHYSEALSRAEILVAQGLSVENALDKCFESNFPPLKKFKKEIE